MVSIGYALSSEEHAPADLIRHAAMAEERGFEFAMISDHFHPWIDRQGHSPFVWGVLGGIAQATDRIWVGTGVTCPILRIHPAIVAHAAATAAALMPGRFVLGLGTGENLNEHVLGQRWPEWEVRAEMLAEAVEIIRRLWTGAQVSHRGRHYEVSNARLYTLPPQPPPIYLAASGERMSQVAARIGDGLIGTGPGVVAPYQVAGGTGPRIGQVTLCWAESKAQARRVAREWWPTAMIHGEASQELPNPANFEDLVRDVTDEQVAEAIPCGPDPGPVISQIREYEKSGYDHIYLHQVGPDQAGFLDFAARELLPAFEAVGAGARPGRGAAAVARRASNNRPGGRSRNGANSRGR
jgi:G6PDH family F420-dependent oxidoreductase